MAFCSRRNTKFVVKAGDVVVVETSTGVRQSFTIGQAGDSASPIAVVVVDEDDGGAEIPSEDEMLPAGGYLLLLDS
jgi:hypothetical protein